MRHIGNPTLHLGESADLSPFTAPDRVTCREDSTRIIPALSGLPLAMSPQTALITGCSRGGIGEALAIDLANRGFHVFAGVRTLAKAPEYVSPSEDGKAKGAMQLILVDVASTDSIRNMVAELKEKLPDGKLDILINNAGIGYTKPVLDADIEDIKRLYDVNFFGILSLTQACIPMLLEAKGKIVNISSIGAVLPLPWNGEASETPCDMCHKLYPDPCREIPKPQHRYLCV